MAWTQTDLATVERAIVQSEMSVSFTDGSQVTYRSVSELLKARDAIKDSLRAAASERTRCTYGEFAKG